MIKEMLPSPAEALETAMANKNDFTPEEWTKVLESIIAAGIAVSAVDPSGQVLEEILQFARGEFFFCRMTAADQLLFLKKSPTSTIGLQSNKELASTAG